MPEKKEKINKGRKFKIKTPGQERDFDTLVKFRKFQRYEQVEDVKLTDEDAAVNSIAGGGVDMAPNAKGVKVFMKRKRAVDGRSKGYREAVKRIKERNAKVVQKNLAQKLSQFGVTSNPFREETKMSNKKYLETKAGSIEAAVLKSLETSVESNETEQTLTMPEKYLESKEGSLTDAALEAMMGENGNHPPQGPHSHGQKSSIGTPLKHPRSWKKKKQKLIVTKGGGTKVVPINAPEPYGQAEEIEIDEKEAEKLSAVDQATMAHARGDTAKRDAILKNRAKAKAKQKAPAKKVAEDDAVSPDAMQRYLRLMNKLDKKKEPPKEAPSTSKQKAPAKKPAKLSAVSKAEEVEFDETITGWGSGHRPAPSKKGSPARRRLEKHNKDLRDKLAADKLARKVETGRIKPKPKAKKKFGGFDETTTGWSNSKVIDKVKFPTGGVKKGSLKDLEKHNKDLRDKKAKKESKETEAGERDVGSDEYTGE